MNKIIVARGIPPDMEYACGLRSIYTEADEFFL
jgi:hypothetical protein